MFNRRPRNYLQVGFIILLMLGVAYLIYLNNNAQVQITTLEAKSQRYQQQQQSLSSQLQGKIDFFFLEVNMTMFYAITNFISTLVLFCVVEGIISRSTWFSVLLKN